MSGPGIIYTPSKIADPTLSLEQFNNWYENVHFKDLLSTGLVKSVSRFKSINPDAEWPYLAIYVLEDMGALQRTGFKSVSIPHESLPDGGPIIKFVDFDTRFYQLVQKVEIGKEDQEGKRGSLNLEIG
jgi:hypothetical protein